MKHCTDDMSFILPPVGFDPKDSTRPEDQRSCILQETFVLSKLMVTFLKNETYGYGSQYSLTKNFGQCILL